MSAEVNRFSRVSALWASFYSRDLYRAVVTNWKGIGVLYLILLLAICWLPSAFGWFRGVSRFAAAEGRELVAQLPIVAIQNGVMTATPAGPHIIRLEADGRSETLAIIDDSIDRVPEDITSQMFVLTRREAGVIRPSRNERRIWTLSPGTDIRVTPQGVAAFLDSTPWWLTPIGYVCALAGSVIVRLLQALLYGAGAMIYAGRRGLTLDYGTAIRLAVVALTPAIVLRTIVELVPQAPTGWLWLVSILVTIGYIVFGIGAVSAVRTEILSET